MRPHRRQPPGSPIPGILQARTLECVAISSGRPQRFLCDYNHTVRISFIQITPFKSTELLDLHSAGSHVWLGFRGLYLYSLSGLHLVFLFLICAINRLLSCVSKGSLEWKKNYWTYLPDTNSLSASLNRKKSEEVKPQIFKRREPASGKNFSNHIVMIPSENTGFTTWTIWPWAETFRLILTNTHVN